MSVSSHEKLRPLLERWIPATVMTSAHLRALGVTPQHTQKYVASKWIEAVGVGAFKRPSDTLTWQGALYSLQSQLGLQVHVGARTAMEAGGVSHYARLGKVTIFLLSSPGTNLPVWFKAQDWPETICHFQSKFLPPDEGLTTTDDGGFALRTSTSERAVLEMLHLAPRHIDLVEVYQIIEGLRTLRPKMMQRLLEACGSIKVTRLFLFMAEKANLPVLRHLDVSKFNLGSGDRSLVPHGAYNAKYGLILPKELVGLDG